MINRIKNIILEEKLINKNENVLIGLSGGPDSVFLFHMLRLLKDNLSFKLYASHINHMYRGEDAEHDQLFVEELCKRYNIKLFIKRKNAVDLAKELKMTEEEAGRKLRYDFFSQNIRNIGNGKIAVAHNLNDQSETVLQRLIRGTGINGLCAMKYKSNNIIRPILGVTKKEVLDFLNENKYDYCSDYTNNLSIYGRNKIRLDLIPYLESNFNPNIQNVLFRMSKIMQNDSKIIENHIEMLYNKLSKVINSDKIILDLVKFNNLDKSECSRVILKVIYKLNGNTKDIENKHIEQILKLCCRTDNNTGKKININKNLLVYINYNEIVLTKTIENMCKFEYNIEIGEKFHIIEVNKSIYLENISVDNLEKKSGLFYIDYDRIVGSLKVRNRRSGDFLKPYGMKGTKKVKNILIDNKVPVVSRDKLLIVEDDKNIIWLEDYRINDDYKITSHTKKILIIKVVEDYDGQHSKGSTI